MRLAASGSWLAGSLLGSSWMAGLILPVIVGVVWELAIRYGLAQGRLMPPPSRLAEAAWALIVSGEMATHIGATMTRVLVGFGLGALAGTLFGVATGASSALSGQVDR